MAMGDPANAEDHGYSFIVALLSTCDSIKPDYHALSKLTGTSTPGRTREKFKKFVEHGGYSLVKDKVVRPATERAITIKEDSKRKAVEGASGDQVAKKHKVQHVEDDQDSLEQDVRDDQGAD